MRRRSQLLGGSLVLLALSACGQPTTSTGPASTGGASPSPSPMAGMDHGGMGHSEATTTSETPFDATFIDSMIRHHEGAIEMARQALEEAEHPEVRELAQEIIDAQQQEIEQMQSWRQEWYPDLPPTGSMHMMDEQMIGDDTSKPFDQRFIEGMIIHHQGAIDMAREAQQQAERQEIQELATTIITDQQREIEQMEQWLREWYGVQ